MTKEQLIALMLTNQVADADIVSEVTCQFGTPKADVAALIAAYKAHPLFVASQSIQQELCKRDWLLAQMDKAFGTDAENLTIDTVDAISDADFYANYYRVNRPLVIKGMGNPWPAVQQWCFETLKDKWGHCPVEVQYGRNSDPRYDQNHKAHTKHMPFAQYVDLVTSTEDSNDFYMTSRNMAENDKAFVGLLDDIDPLPSILNKNFSSTIAFLWVGPKGAKTQLHHDMSNNLHTQVIGKKQFRLASPFQLPYMYHYNNYWSRVPFPQDADFDQHPLMAKARFTEVTLEPGDTIFIPVFWWHCVESLSPSVSVAFHNFKENNQFSDFNASHRFSYHQD